MPGRRTAQQGFSLLELMVAVAILSLALIPLLVNQGTSRNNALYMHEKTLAFLAADNLLLETVARERVSTGTKNGTTTQGGIQFKWQSEVSPLPDTSISSITVRVYHRGNGKKLSEMTGFHPGKQK